MLKKWRPAFFTGGTALRTLSAEMARRGISSCHLVTTFDSGGSSAELRKTFAIPAVGDLRNRLLALADTSIVSPQLLNFCKYRLPLDISLKEARTFLKSIPHTPSFWHGIDKSIIPLLQTNLDYFLRRMPASFDARGACMGNLLITGSYLENRRDFTPALALFSTLFHIVGSVAPIVDANVNLGAILENGSRIVGQHIFHHLPAPVKDIFLTVHGSPTDGGLEECHPPISPRAAEYLAQADLICYPMGSFFSSILANLLPAGVGRAIAASGAPKIFIPNSGHDGELGKLDISGQIDWLLRLLRQDCPEAKTSQLLNYVLVDRDNGLYPGGLTGNLAKKLDHMGIQLLERHLLYKAAPQHHAPRLLLDALMAVPGNA